MLRKHVFLTVLHIYARYFRWTCFSQLYSLIYDHWYLLLAQAASFANRWLFGCFYNHLSLSNFCLNCRLWLRQWQGWLCQNSGFHALYLRMISYFPYVLALYFLNWVQVVSCCKSSRLLDSTSLPSLRSLHHLWVFICNSNFRLALLIWIDLTSLFWTIYLHCVVCQRPGRIPFYLEFHWVFTYANLAILVTLRYLFKLGYLILSRKMSMNLDSSLTTAAFWWNNVWIFKSRDSLLWFIDSFTFIWWKNKSPIDLILSSRINLCLFNRWFIRFCFWIAHVYNDVGSFVLANSALFLLLFWDHDITLRFEIRCYESRDNRTF